MRHTKDCAVFAQLVDGRLHLGLSHGVARGGGLVAHEDRRVADEGPRDGQALALPTGQRDTARADAGENVLRRAAAVKVFASEMCGRVVDRVVQIYGGAGYLAEYDAERFFRDARIYRIYEGTTQILQLQIAKHMLRDYAAGL